MTDHPTSIRLARQLKDDLKKEAVARRWPLSTLIQQILEAWMKKAKEKR